VLVMSLSKPGLSEYVPSGSSLRCDAVNRALLQDPLLVARMLVVGREALMNVQNKVRLCLHFVLVGFTSPAPSTGRTRQQRHGEQRGEHTHRPSRIGLPRPSAAPHSPALWAVTSELLPCHSCGCTSTCQYSWAAWAAPAGRGLPAAPSPHCCVGCGTAYHGIPCVRSTSLTC